MSFKRDREIGRKVVKYAKRRRREQRSRGRGWQTFYQLYWSFAYEAWVINKYFVCEGSMADSYQQRVPLSWCVLIGES